jgi:hypothetical protein
LLALPACESLPGTRTQQSTTAGAAVGAGVGAVLGGEDNRLVGALLGAAVGAAGGYLIGARTSWFDTEAGRRQALDAVSQAQRDPATASQALAAKTADVDQDGFVTLDEMVAMESAGLSDAQMLSRLRATGQIFDVDASQERALLSAGISPEVVAELPRINQQEKERVLSRSQG